MTEVVFMMMGVFLVINIARSLYLRYKERNAFERGAYREAVRRQQESTDYWRHLDPDMGGPDLAAGDETDMEKVLRR